MVPSLMLFILYPPLKLIDKDEFAIYPNSFVFVSDTATLAVPTFEVVLSVIESTVFHVY